MSNRVSNDQLEELLNFLAEHPAIARGVGLGARSKENVERQWNDLAHKLNAFGSGSAKSGERWKKYWADLKHKSKSRMAQRRRDAFGTGGGPSSQDNLSEVDQKVLAIIGQQAVFGDTQHRIPLSNRESDTQRPLDILSVDIIAEPHGEAESLPIVCSSPAVNSPSRWGHTTQLYTDYIETVPSNTVDIELPVHLVSQQLPEATHPQQAPQEGATSPVNRPTADRPPRRIIPARAANSLNSSRITPEWVQELEGRRVESESKLANAALIMAESSRLQAETARAQAEMMHQLLELFRRQSEDIRALLQTTRAANGDQ